MSDEESNPSDAESEPEAKPAKIEQSETQKVLQKREEAKRQESAGLDETVKELLELNRQEREKMEDEIEELRRRSEKRKKQREVEEKRLAAERAAEDERRKAAEEAKKRQKSEDEEKKQKERARKMAEFEKWKQPQTRNFVITKKAGGSDDENEEDNENEDKSDAEKSKKTKEQLEAEKKAILKQRIKPLEIDGLDQAKMAEKAKEFHSWLARLEGERYDLEKRFKSQQSALVDLAERARQANKVGKGGLKRIGGPDDVVDKIQAKYAGAPAKVEMFSKYERQKDKRSYDDRHQIFTGPQFISPVDRIKPQKILQWDEEGMPIYTGAAPAAAAAAE